jgi:hypothetical protein
MSTSPSSGPDCFNGGSRRREKKSFLSRRDFLFGPGEGIGGLALSYLLAREGLLAGDPKAGLLGCAGAAKSGGLAASVSPHFPPRAKAVISLFMSGGVSHIDTFDPKPALEKYHGQRLTGKGEVRVRQGYPGPLMKSPFRAKRFGQSGIEITEVFPHVGSVVDELALIRSAKGRSSDHSLSHFEWNTGSVRAGFPSVGSWLTYGLGSESQDLPAFVVMYDRRGGPHAGAANWNSGFLPATTQGTVFRATGDPILHIRPPDGITPERQRSRLDFLAWLNEEHVNKHPGSDELAARIASYELVYRMQGCAPQAVDLTSESDATKSLYGLDAEITEPFGKQCLLARRLLERGVRFVQLYSGSTAENSWDAHDNLKKNHSLNAQRVDKPIAGLIQDLKLRGLLDETLVIWHSEFGRMPISQRGVGRDHNPGAMTIWMAGAGIQGGQVIGASDELGYEAVEQVVTNHDVHATILHLMGLDHKRLTYSFNGRQMRLTDVHGELIPQIIS